VDKETVVEGVRIYGSPWQPWFMDWAFNAPRDPSEGADFLDEKWAAIPEDTDILVTHCPPTGGGRLDDGRDIGCPRLTSRIRYLNLDLHVFGHAHSGYGVYCSSNTKTTSINASICDEHYRAINAPILVRI
jgi:Icc-related predicted phosphoesterase